MALRIKFSKDIEVIQDLVAKRNGVLDSFVNVMDSYMEELRMKIINNYLSGGPGRVGNYEDEHVPTDKLINSVMVIPAHISGNKVLGGVESSGGRAWYGVLHEYGGVQESYPIKADPSKMGRYAHSLHFIWRGKEFFVKEVTRFAMPRRPFMAPARAEMAPEIQAGMKGLLTYYMRAT